jgi:polyphenol oxidase
MREAKRTARDWTVAEAKGGVGKLEGMVTDGMRVEVVRVPGWARYGWLRHGFSTRVGGVSAVYGGRTLNLGFTKEDDPAAVRENRRLFMEAVAGSEAGPLVTVRQVHGTRVKVVAAGETGLETEDGRAVVEADGLMTAAAGVLLGIQVADCVPVLVADVKQRVVAAFHAGWRGTVAGIVEQGIGTMREEFGSSVEDLVGAVGPSIGGCCYAVGDEVRGEFGRAFGDASSLFEDRGGEMFLDLAEANRRQMVGAGLRADAVTVLGECTGCGRLADGGRKYFSHRVERGVTGRAMGMIGVGE